MTLTSAITGTDLTAAESVVTLFNTGSCCTGHAMIMVERNDKGRLFLGRYEVSAKLIQDRKVSDIVQRTMGNNQGYILDFNVFEPPYSRYPKNTQNYSKTSWFVDDPDLLQSMIDAIILDKAKLDKAKEERKELPFLYQTAGAYRHRWLGGNGGHSCLTWAEDKLKLAGINTKSSWFDLIKALPELHVDSNCSLQ